jgi:hypothetical protein
VRPSAHDGNIFPTASGFRVLGRPRVPHGAGCPTAGCPCSGSARLYLRATPPSGKRLRATESQLRARSVGVSGCDLVSATTVAGWTAVGCGFYSCAGAAAWALSLARALHRDGLMPPAHLSPLRIGRACPWLAKATPNPGAAGRWAATHGWGAR